MFTHAVADEPPSVNTLCISNFVKLSAFVAFVGDAGKNKAIIDIFPASHLAAFVNANQNTVGLLAADLCPVDVYNISA